MKMRSLIFPVEFCMVFGVVLVSNDLALSVSSYARLQKAKITVIIVITYFSWKLYFSWTTNLPLASWAPAPAAMVPARPVAVQVVSPAEQPPRAVVAWTWASRFGQLVYEW